MLLANAMQRDPCAGRIADVVVKIVTGGPAGHRALLDAECEAAFLCGLQRNEMLVEVDQVLIHAVLLIPAYKSANGIHFQQ